jgi:hypothetical protein
MKSESFRRMLWGIVNAIFLLLFAWLGYTGLVAERLRGTNPDLFFCIVAFVAISLITVGRLHFAKAAIFRKPSWGRFPLNWSTDPLQAILISTCWWTGFVIGNVYRLLTSNLGADKTVLWTVLFYVSVLAGLVVGQVIVYALYKDRIEKTG